MVNHIKTLVSEILQYDTLVKTLTSVEICSRTVNRSLTAVLTAGNVKACPNGGSAPVSAGINVLLAWICPNSVFY